MATVELSPANQLGFQRPLTRLVTETLRIHNPHPHPVAFKVKTTAPKQYCVRPNSGRVESGETVEVQVLLQPLASEPPPHAKCKDKFLVQSAFITPDEEMRTLADMWSQTEKTNKAAIQEQKIKCVYLAPRDGHDANGIPEEEETGMESKIMDESAIYAAAESSPINTTHTQDVKRDITGSSSASPLAAPLPSSNTIPTTSVSTVNGNIDSSSHSKETAAKSEPFDTKREIPSLTAEDIQKSSTSGVSPTNASLEGSLARTTSDAEKLKIAMAEIDRLKAQLAEAQGPQVTGLRKRGTGGAAGVAGEVKAGAEVALDKAKEVAHAQEGVPVEMVAALVVGVFVMTYLFF